MEIDLYQRLAKTYAVYKEENAVTYPMLGLVSEVGEVAGKMKKFMRDGGNKEQFEKDLRSELGDVLWYLAALASDLGFSLDELAEENLNKLYDRSTRNVIKGSGDNR